MSMRLRMGCVQIFVTPGMRSFSSSRCIIASFVSPAGHWSFGLKVTIVSVMLIGAGSVDVSARPIFPTTEAIAGSCEIIRSCSRNNSVAFDNDMLGSVTGIHIAVSSSKGGMNSDPLLPARDTANTKRIAGEASVSHHRRYERDRRGDAQ